MIRSPRTDVEAGGEQNDGGRSGQVSPTQMLTLPPVDAEQHRFPYCLVWGPLPCISWCLPCIGHAGIGDSSGRIHDFAGPYYIGVDSFMVGETKYAQINPNLLEPDYTRNRLACNNTTRASKQQWDEAVAVADKSYSKQMHNICCNNCHHHAADALNHMGLKPNSMLGVWWYLLLHGKYTSNAAVVQTWAPFLVIVAIIVVLSLMWL